MRSDGRLTPTQRKWMWIAFLAAGILLLVVSFSMVSLGLAGGLGPTTPDPAPVATP